MTEPRFWSWVTDLHRIKGDPTTREILEIVDAAVKPRLGAHCVKTFTLSNKQILLLFWNQEVDTWTRYLLVEHPLA